MAKAKKQKRRARGAKKAAKGTRKGARTGSRRRSAARKTSRPARRKPAAGRRAAKSRTSSSRRAGNTGTAATTKARSGSPRPAKRSTRTGAGAGTSRSPYLERERRRLRDIEEEVTGPPSSLDFDRHASAARSGRRELQEALHEHTESSPALTGGDVDADWRSAYASGDEAPGGDNPTPDQDRVDDIGKSLGVQYEDNEELKSVDKIDERDRHRWELDPASAEDYKERQK